MTPVIISSRIKGSSSEVIGSSPRCSATFVSQHAFAWPVNLIPPPPNPKSLEFLERLDRLASPGKHTEDVESDLFGDVRVCPVNKIWP